MYVFFLGWRRKAGCATLVLACLLMAWWMRSLFTADIATCIVPSLGRTFSVHSVRGTTEWHILAGNSSRGLHWWFSGPVINYTQLAGAEHIQLRVHRAGEPIHVLVIPHWLLILPLALLAGYLVLWRPRMPV